MRSYVYRWVYAGLVFMLTLLLGYFLVIKPYLRQWYALNQEEQRLTVSVVNAKKQAPLGKGGHTAVRHITKNALDCIADIQAMALKRGLIINAVSDAVVLRFDLQGDYGKFAHFVSDLSAAGYAQMIKGVSMQLDKLHQLHVTLALATLASSSVFPVKQQKPADLTMYNPFCLQVDRWVAQADPALQHIDIRLLENAKMIGYLQQGHRSQALIVFPSNQLLTLEEGDILGKEGAEVMAIAVDHVLFKISENNYWKLKW